MLKKNTPKLSIELKKHAASIHSSGKLTLLQRKIANVLLYHAYSKLLDQDEHCIHIETLCSLIGYNSHDYKTIKTALKKLISTVVEWNLVDRDRIENHEVWIASGVIADASISGAICTYSYSKKMRELLYHPEIYGRLNIKVQAQFQSTYGLALYENCIRFQNIKQTPWFDLITFRKLMGVEEGKYIFFYDFNRRVLSKAIQEVNQYSSLFLTVKLKRTHQKVMALQFIIQKIQPSLITLKENPLVVEENLNFKLKEKFGFPENKIKYTLENYTEDYILKKIDLIESSASFRQGKIKNLARYLEEALANDFQAPKASPSPIVDSGHLYQEKIASNALEEKRREDDEHILNQLSNLASKEKKKIVKMFEKHLKGNLYENIYKRERLKNVLISDQFCLFVRSIKYGPLLGQIVNDDLDTKEKIQ